MDEVSMEDFGGLLRLVESDFSNAQICNTSNNICVGANWFGT